MYDSYIDADSKESFFTCCWTVDFQSKEPLLAVGGLKGIIRTILPTKSQLKSALLGHGSSINELRIHPSKQSILLSASKDHTIRLWNLKNDVCIVVFGGCEGHRDEVLSAVCPPSASITLINIILKGFQFIWYLNYEL